MHSSLYEVLRDNFDVKKLLVNKIAELREDLTKMQRSMASIYVGNILIQMTKKFFPEKRNGGATVKLQRLAAHLSDKQLSEARIPSEYWKSLCNLSKVYFNFLYIRVCMTKVEI